MEIVTKTGQPRTTDRLRQALGTLASLVDRTINEVNTLDSDFQERMLQAVHDTETSLQLQTVEHVARVREETESRVRALMADEAAAVRKLAEKAVDEARSRLAAESERISRDLASTKEAHQREIAEAEKSHAAARDREVSAAVERVRSETAAEVESISAERDSARALLHDAKVRWERAAAQEKASAEAAEALRQEVERWVKTSEDWRIERSHLLGEIDRSKQLLIDSQSESSRAAIDAERTAASRLESEMAGMAERMRELSLDRDRLSDQLDQVVQSAAQWEAERSRLNEECARTNQLLAEAQALQARSQARTGPGGGSPGRAPETAASLGVDKDALKAEVARVESLVHAISELIDDPATELSVVIRKNVERAEFESYLKGIRFAVSGA